MFSFKPIRPPLIYTTLKNMTKGDKAWVQQVGGAQLLLPVHVINEYCHPTRPFYPLPNFKDGLGLPRNRTIDKGEWFTASYAGGNLGRQVRLLQSVRAGREGRVEGAQLITRRVSKRDQLQARLTPIAGNLHDGW